MAAAATSLCMARCGKVLTLRRMVGLSVMSWPWLVIETLGGVTTTAPINNVAGIGNSRKVQLCWHTYFTSDLALV